MLERFWAVVFFFFFEGCHSAIFLSWVFLGMSVGVQGGHLYTIRTFSSQGASFQAKQSRAKDICT